eukprot:11544752-Heterocapsa_arctica.AAC.1
MTHRVPGVRYSCTGCAPELDAVPRPLPTEDGGRRCSPARYGGTEEAFAVASQGRWAGRPLPLSTGGTSA